MAKIAVSFEKTTKDGEGKFQHQELIISAEANSREEAENLSYNDFRFDLFINGKFIADISHVLAKTNVFEDLIDGEDWAKEYCDKNAERKVNVTIHEEINY
jgi:hypothetical protein